MSTTHRLYLLRHAQAFPGGPSDLDRRLDAQGETDARALGALLAARAISPGRVVSSPSARTRGTLECLHAAGLTGQATFEPALYNGSESVYRDLARSCDGAGLMIIGHNPAIGALARSLASEGETDAMERLRGGFPTCSLAILRLEAGLGHGVLETLLVPPHPLR